MNLKRKIRVLLLVLLAFFIMAGCGAADTAVTASQIGTGVTAETPVPTKLPETTAVPTAVPTEVPVTEPPAAESTPEPAEPAPTENVAEPEQTEKQPESTSSSGNGTAETEDTSAADTGRYSYIVNTNTGKIHLPYCPSVDDMNEKNKLYTNESLEELEKEGYVPCKRCLG